MLRVILALILSIAFVEDGRASDSLNTPDKLIDEFLSAYYSSVEPGASVIVSRGEEVVLRKGYGVVNAQTMAPVQPETVFWLGSISKQFAAMALLLLVEEGRVSLSDPITLFFPEWPRFFSHVSVEHLLTHTSGLRNYSSLSEFEGKELRSAAHILAAIRDRSLSFNPGEGWEYSDSNYYLVGLIIERVTGVAYCRFVESRLFGPLGMSRTKCGPGESSDSFASGYIRGAEEFSAAETPDAVFYSAAGAVVSTVDDLLLWYRALKEGRLIAGELQQQVFRQATLRSGKSTIYGYGWVVHDLSGLRVIEHGGLIGGFENHILWIPQEDIFVAILSNQRGKLPNPDTLATRIALSLSSLRIPLRNEGPGSPLPPAAAGVYKMEDRHFEISESEWGATFRRTGGGEAVRMVRFTPGIFALETTLTLVRFLPTQEGDYWALSMKNKYGQERVAVRSLGDPRSSWIGRRVSLRNRRGPQIHARWSSMACRSDTFERLR